MMKPFFKDYKYSMEIKHPNLLALDKEIIWNNGSWLHRVTIVTDLITDAFDKDYDADAVYELVRFVAIEMGKHHQGFDELTIRSHLSYYYNSQVQQNVAL